jgi:hypothetical protein
MRSCHHVYSLFSHGITNLSLENMIRNTTEKRMATRKPETTVEGVNRRIGMAMKSKWKALEHLVVIVTLVWSQGTGMNGHPGLAFTKGQMNALDHILTAVLETQKPIRFHMVLPMPLRTRPVVLNTTIQTHKILSSRMKCRSPRQSIPWAVNPTSLI